MGGALCGWCLLMKGLCWRVFQTGIQKFLPESLDVQELRSFSLSLSVFPEKTAQCSVKGWKKGPESHRSLWTSAWPSKITFTTASMNPELFLRGREFHPVEHTRPGNSGVSCSLARVWIRFPVFHLLPQCCDSLRALALKTF